MQKVLLLPIVHDMKACIFTPRLVVFNETFAEMKEREKKTHYLCVWNESQAGRKKEDIARAIYKVFQKERDVAKLIFWMDNCSGQNKNWTFI